MIIVKLQYWPSEEQRQPVYYKPVGNVRKNGPSLILDKTLVEKCFSGRDLTNTRATLTAFEEGEGKGVVLHYYRTNKEESSTTSRTRNQEYPCSSGPCSSKSASRGSLERVFG